MNQEVFLQKPETRVAEQLWSTVRMLQTGDVLITEVHIHELWR